jgi:multiple sugar transport system permease protein
MATTTKREDSFTSRQITAALDKPRRQRNARSAWYYVGQAVIYLWLTFMAVYAIMPIMWMFSTSLRLPARSFELPPSFFPTEWRWSNWWDVFTSDLINYPLFFLNSLKVATLITASQLLLASMAAFAFARLRFPGRQAIFMVFLATMMVPAQVTIVPRFILIRNLQLIDTHWAMILPAMVGAYGVFLLRQFFMTLPGELVDSARIDGAGFFQIYSRIMLPLVGPGLSALGVFVFNGSWNNFFGALLFLRSWEKMTLPIALFALQGYMGEGSRAHVLAAIMMSIVPVLLIYLFAQRFVLRGIALTGLKG